MRVFLAALLALSIFARAALADDAPQAPAPVAEAPSDAIPSSENFSLNVARRPWWRPAAISLGATAAAAGLSIALIRSGSTDANVWGWTALPFVVTLAPALGWADADDSGTKRSAAAGFAIARGAVFLVGWTSAGIAALSSICVSDNVSTCPSQRDLDGQWNTAKVLFWGTPVVAGALAVADIITQAAFADAPPIHLAPTMLTAGDNKKVPGIALGGSF